MTKPLLTKLDWKLLELLQKDGRMSISDLAKQVNRSRSNVSEHLEKLEDSGILTGITVKVDMNKLGFGISAFVRLQTSSSKLFDIINRITNILNVKVNPLFSKVIYNKIYFKNQNPKNRIKTGKTKYLFNYKIVVI